MALPQQGLDESCRKRLCAQWFLLLVNTACTSHALAEQAQGCGLLSAIQGGRLCFCPARRSFVARAVQLLPAMRYTAAEKGGWLSLGAHDEHSLALRVHAGATLEIALAQVGKGVHGFRGRVPSAGPSTGLLVARRSEKFTCNTVLQLRLCDWLM